MGPAAREMRRLNTDTGLRGTSQAYATSGLPAPLPQDPFRDAASLGDSDSEPLQRAHVVPSRVNKNRYQDVYFTKCNRVEDAAEVVPQLLCMTQQSARAGDADGHASAGHYGTTGVVESAQTDCTTGLWWWSATVGEHHAFAHRDCADCLAGPAA